MSQLEETVDDLIGNWKKQKTHAQKSTQTASDEAKIIVEKMAFIQDTADTLKSNLFIDTSQG